MTGRPQSARGGNERDGVNVQVILRCRPQSKEELATRAPVAVKCNETNREVWKLSYTNVCCTKTHVRALSSIGVIRSRRSQHLCEVVITHALVLSTQRCALGQTNERREREREREREGQKVLTLYTHTCMYPHLISIYASRCASTKISQENRRTARIHSTSPSDRRRNKSNSTIPLFVRLSMKCSMDSTAQSSRMVKLEPGRHTRYDGSSTKTLYTHISSAVC